MIQENHDLKTRVKDLQNIVTELEMEKQRTFRSANKASSILKPGLSFKMSENVSGQQTDNRSADKSVKVVDTSPF